MDNKTPSLKPSGLFRASLVVGVGTLLCRIFGFLRVLTIAYVFGINGLTDVYNTANTTPSIIYELMLGGVLSATLLPTFVRLLKAKDFDGINAILTVTALCLLGLTILTVFGAPLIMSMYTMSRQDDPAEFYQVGTKLVAFFMPQIFFYGLIALSTALLNAQKKFALPAYAPIFNNLVVIAVLLTTSHFFPGALDLSHAANSPLLIAFLGLAPTIGIALSALVLLPSILKSGFTLRFLPDFKHPAIQSVLKLSGWTLGYVIANQLALFAVTTIALSREGWLTAYQNAFIFFLLPHGLLAMSITTTLAPGLSQEAASENLTGLKSKLAEGLRLLALLMVPASVGYILIAHPLVTTLLEHGRFNGASSEMTSGTLSMFAVGLFPFSAYLFLLRGFYALQDTRTPFWINALENLVNIALALPLTYYMGVQGLALSYALAYCFAAALTIWALGRRLGGFTRSDIEPTLSRVAIASIGMGVIVWGVLYALKDQNALLQTLVSVMLGGLTYGGLTILLKTPELRYILKSRR